MDFEFSKQKSSHRLLKKNNDALRKLLDIEGNDSIIYASLAKGLFNFSGELWTEREYIAFEAEPNLKNIKETIRLSYSLIKNITLKTDLFSLGYNIFTSQND